MAQTKLGFITLTDLDDGSAYITHTAYQNYDPATAIDLPTVDTLTSEVLTGLGVNGWTTAPSTPSGSSLTFFTTRIFKQSIGIGNFIGQGSWSTASQLSGDIGRPGDPGVSNTGRYKDLQTSFESKLTLTTAGVVGNVLKATLGGTAITYTVVTDETSTTDMATGLASAIDSNATFNGSATASGDIVTINRDTTFSTAFESTGSTTGAYVTVDNKDFKNGGTGSRWKIRTDTGAIPNATGGVNQWTTSVKVLFLSSSDENGTAISDYYATLEADDLGRLQTDADATPSSANIPDFCDITNINGEPFICDSPAGYVVFKLLATPVRMDPDGTVNAVNGGVWRMSIETVRADTTPTLNTGSNILANFGYNRAVTGEDGQIGTRGAGRFDRNFTIDNNTAYAAGSAEFNSAARCAVAGGYPFNASESVVTCVANANNSGSTIPLVTPVEGDVVVLTVTEKDGGLETVGAVHDGSGPGNGAWKDFAIQIDGNLLVQGTVAADALSVDSVTADKIKAGAITADKVTLLTPADVGAGGTGSDRMVILSDRIDIYNDGVLRVRLGNLNP